MSPVVYRIDGTDRLTYVNRAWRTFADHNDGDSVLPPDPRGARIWDLLGADPSTLQIYQTLVTRVRTSRVDVQFAFRCDAPDRVRLMRMTIRGRDNGEVEFRVDALADRARAPVALLEAGRSRSSDVQVVCGWCKRVRVADGAWMEVEEAIHSLGLFTDTYPPALSHGICERCQEAFTAALEGSNAHAPVLRPPVSSSGCPRR